MKEILAQKHALEQKCSELQKENKKLKIDLREAGRSKRQEQWTSQDEEEFLQSRRIRREDQSLVKSALSSHMERVNYIYDIKNQCFVSNKPHFNLSFPKHFQRAPQLDIRDLKNDELLKQQAEIDTSGSEEKKNSGAKLAYKSETKNTTASAGAPSRRSKLRARNSGMSALKKLAMTKGRS